jgi:hypothetical protein
MINFRRKWEGNYGFWSVFRLSANLRSDDKVSAV